MDTIQTTHLVAELFKDEANVSFKEDQIIVSGIKELNHTQLNQLQGYEYIIKRSGPGLTLKVKANQ